MAEDGAPSRRQRNTIRTFALICVAVTSAFLVGLAIWLIAILSAPDWCVRAIGAAQQASRPESAIGSCFVLLQQQVAALALNSHIAIGIIALCLGVLMVIVVAGGRLSFKAGRDGASADIGSDKREEP